MKRKIRALFGVSMLVAAVVIAANLVIIDRARASLPWGAISQPVATGSPVLNTYVCASFSSDPVCLVAPTTNIAGLTLSGGTAGVSYTIIFMQDGTGSRLLTVPSNLVANTGQTLPALTTAANSWTVWVVTLNSSAQYVVQGTFDNLDLSKDFVTTATMPTTGIAVKATLAMAGVTLPGITTANGCLCLPETWGTNAQTGLSVQCIPTTNTATCQLVNGTATGIVPDSEVLQVREIK